ncbi:MAG: DUF1778 domain-containing protein [Ottowia sp.]|nr:DUF1778 domain-containing protein [Ottowia sp.]
MTAATINFDAAINPEQRALLQRAAEKQGRSLTDFVVAAVLEVAQRVIALKQPVRPSALLEQHRIQIREAVARYRLSNPRVFGSVAQGTDHQGSDLDILVDSTPDTTLLDLGGLQEDLQDLLGIRVDVCTPGGLPETWRGQVLAQALPV